MAPANFSGDRFPGRGGVGGDALEGIDGSEGAPEEGDQVRNRILAMGKVARMYKPILGLIQGLGSGLPWESFWCWPVCQYWKFLGSMVSPPLV